MTSDYSLLSLDITDLRVALTNSTITPDSVVIFFPNKLSVSYPTGGYLTIPLDLSDVVYTPLTLAYDKFAAAAAMARKRNHQLIIDTTYTLHVICGDEVVLSESLSNVPTRVPQYDVTVNAVRLSYGEVLLWLKFLSGASRSGCLISDDVWYVEANDATAYLAQRVYPANWLFNVPLSLHLSDEQLRMVKAFMERLATRQTPDPPLYFGYGQGFLKFGNKVASCVLDVSGSVQSPPVALPAAVRLTPHANDAMLMLSFADVETLLALPKAANRPYGRLSFWSEGLVYHWRYVVEETQSQVAIDMSGSFVDATGFPATGASEVTVHLDALSFFGSVRRLLSSVPCTAMGITLLWDAFDPTIALRLGSTEHGDKFYVLTMPIFLRPSKEVQTQLSDEVKEMEIEEPVELLTA